MRLTQIHLSPLACIETAGGNVLHAMKQTDTGFAGFGEAYFSWVAKGAVKAWKRHTRMTMNLIVPVGMVRFVFFSDECKAVREEMLGEGRYMRATVPPGIWFGFQGLNAPQSLVLNIANILHDPQEVERRAKSEISFDWD
jgi:dTDP-4-dehydrorhamnose 3,5-epimerase